MTPSGLVRHDYRRRRHLMEGSFAQATNGHGFKRARWRRLWRQQIQDWLIAACQNVKPSSRPSVPGRSRAKARLRARRFGFFAQFPFASVALPPNSAESSHGTPTTPFVSGDRLFKQHALKP